MHFRAAGEEGAPLLVLHASPGSSRQQLGLIADFAGNARVFAPDTPGNGDSVALADREPTIPELAEAMLTFLDIQGIERVCVYGTHTGAAIGAELALAAPDRVSHLVMDGISHMRGEELAEALARYAPPFEPDHDGAGMIRLFRFCRDQFLFFPWYRHTRESRRDGGLPPAADLHALVTEVMKAGSTYHRNYHAAFKWPAAERLPLLTCPTLIVAARNDPLHDATRQLAGGRRFISLPRFDHPDYRAARHAVMTAFFDEDT